MRCRKFNLGLVTTVALAAAAARGGAVAHAAEAPRRPPNVLFIAVDDLRPQLGCYGRPEMITPALDRLAQEGRRFEHHYVQVPTCGASRCALLTGHYPPRVEAYDNNAIAALPREVAASSMPALFRRNGYTTVSIGKVSHAPDGMRADGEPELPFSWDEVGVPHGKWTDAWAAFFGYADGSTRIRGQSPVSEQADVPDDGYPDSLIASAAIEKLRELKDRQFYLAVGFFKPHLPFNAPRRYWDLYSEDDFPAPPNPEPPRNVDPAISLHHSGEMLDQYTGFSTPGEVAPAEARRLRYAYAACVSYADAQIGRVLDELDRLGLRDNTIVVVWGDHGWHLGEHGIWGKHTLHDVALRSPLIVRTPRMAHPGKPAAGFVESVDIYPMLATLCGFEPPRDLDGKSFAALLRDPKTPGKSAVYGFWRGGRGHTVRTKRYRYIEWTAEPEYAAKIVQSELYDHKHDPDETENIAVAHPQIVRALSAQLRRVVPVLQP